VDRDGSHRARNGSKKKLKERRILSIWTQIFAPPAKFEHFEFVPKLRMGGLFWSKTGAGASRDHFKAGLVAHREKKARCLLCLALMNTSSDCRDLAKVVEDSLRSSSANISMARRILPLLRYERPSVFFLHKDIKDLLHCVCAKMSKPAMFLP
jgi:hypothetical protein